MSNCYKISNYFNNSNIVILTKYFFSICFLRLFLKVLRIFNQYLFKSTIKVQLIIDTSTKIDNRSTYVSSVTRIRNTYHCKINTTLLRSEFIIQTNLN